MKLVYEDINTYASFTNLLVREDASSVIRENVDVIAGVLPEINDMEGFDQKSVYHNLDVLEHTLKVLDGIPCDAGGKKDIVLAYSALFHDVAKPECFVFDPVTQHGHMDGHPEAGVVIFEEFAQRMNIPSDIARDISALILYHDTYVDRTIDSVTRMVELMTPRLMDKLQILQRADILAHSSQGLTRLEILEEIIRIRENII